MEPLILPIHEALFRANIYHFIPHYPTHKYPQLYRQIMKNQIRTYRDYVHNDPVRINALIEGSSGWFDQLRTSPGIIATYHLNSYRLLNLCMACSGIPIALIVTKEVAAKEREWMASIYSKLMNDRLDRFILLVADDPHSLLHMRQLLKKGYCLIAYVDGNRGSREGNDKHLLDIPFGNGKISVRQGLAWLSYLTDAHIYPVWYDNICGQPRLRTVQRLQPTIHEKGQDYAHRATAQLFQLLEGQVLQNPAGWECWRYIHEWSHGSHSWMHANDFKTIIENNLHQRWQTFKIGKSTFTIDASCYRFYEIRG